MKLTSKELKRRARGILTGHYGLPMRAFLIIELIVLLISSPFGLPLESRPNAFQLAIWLLSSLIISLLSTVLRSGLTQIHLNLSRGKKAKLMDLFFFFTRRPDRFILAELIKTGLFTAVFIPISICIAATVLTEQTFTALTVAVSLLTMAAVYVLSLMFSQVYYLLIDQPELGLFDAFRKSRKLMKGNKARYFYLDLSFIGVSLLGVLSLGIGLLWVIPYQSQTKTEFYRSIQNDFI